MGLIYACCRTNWDGGDKEEKSAILQHEAINYQELPVPIILAEEEDSRGANDSMMMGGDLSQEFLSVSQEGDILIPPRWSTPRSSTNTDPESDEELQAFIHMRNQTDKASEEWEKLNYDIHTLKCARREISARWRKILLLLGYEEEVDTLLSVNRQTALLESEHLEQARQMLHAIGQESCLFPPGLSNDRYIFVMDRLISLDSAEEFVRLAKDKYPKA
ncbi:melanoregulin-like [Engraulis encrasicolus]|uniref:melanoregulin-like n=1 Tax=Engraulis encrasicolus TaxID=184585 RepID=UPI002FD6A95F